MQTNITRQATFVCSVLLSMTLISMWVWIFLMIIPMMPLLATFPVLAHIAGLLYGIPCLVYLCCGKYNPDDCMPELSIRIPVSWRPKTNYRMCKHAARYVYFVITNAPRFIFAMAKHVYLPRVRATVIGRTVELYRVIRAFARGEHRLPGIDKTPGCRTQLNQIYGSRYHRLDIYYPTITAFVKSPHETPDLSPSSSSESVPQLGADGRPAQAAPTTPPSPSPAAHSSAGKDKDKGKGKGKAKSNFDPFHVRMKVSPEFFGIPTNPPAHVPNLHEVFIPAAPWPDPAFAKPVVVFFHDIGVKGPLKPHRRHYALFARKLVDQGYVVVVPDISSGHGSRVADYVTNIRGVLDWTYNDIGKYNGCRTKMYVAGHGLGAHLATLTLLQEAVNKSRKWEMKLAKGKSNIETLRKGLYMNPFQVYGEHVPLPVIRGIIMMSPIQSLATQVKYEAAQGLAGLSTILPIFGGSRLQHYLHSISDLIYDTKTFIRWQFLPPILIIHGEKDKIVPWASSRELVNLMDELKLGGHLEVYRLLGHWDIIKSMMKGFEDSTTRSLLDDFETFIDYFASDEPEPEPGTATEAQGQEQVQA